MKTLALGLAVLFLVSCGGGKPVTPKQKGLTDKDKNPVIDPTKVLCPAQVPPHVHRLNLHFNRNLPTNIGIRLDTDASPRVSSCADLTQAGPLVSFAKLTANDLLITIEHRGFYASLPRDASLEIYDLGNCGPDMTSFYKVAPAVPITWRIESPNGTNCANRALGEYKGNAVEMVGESEYEY